jgi:hypothetical protein
VSLRPRGTGCQQRILQSPIGAHLEGVAKAPRLLESRTKHLVSSDIGIGNGSSSEPHCLFEMFTVESALLTATGWKDLHSDGRNIILLVLLIHEVNIDILTSSLGLVLLLSVLSHIALDTGSDSKLGSSLTDLGEIGTRESSSVLGEEVEIDTRSEGRLSQSC